MECKYYNIIIMLSLYRVLAAGQMHGQPLEGIDTSSVVQWINQKAVPLQHITAGNTFADLKPLKKVLKNTRVVGVGEATHGTREFFQAQHRMLEFLVQELGYTMFIMEASYSACKPINEYVLHGKGDRDALLTGQGYLAWDNEAFTTIIDWIRTYNQGMPEHKKVSFYGIDLCFNGVGRELVLKYLEKHMPAEAAPAKAWFAPLDQEEKHWPFTLDQAVIATIYPLLKGLMQRMENSKPQLVAASSEAEYREIHRHLRIMEQWIIANTPELVLPPGEKRMDRGGYMAENFFYLMDQNPQAKCMFRGHNYHAAANPSDPSVGYFIRERLGDQYYAIGATCIQGTFLYRVLLPDNKVGGFEEYHFLPMSPASLPGTVGRSTHENLILNLRNARGVPPAVQKWLQDPVPEMYGNWVSEGILTQNTYGTCVLQEMYDAILYIRTSTPSRPNQNALEIAGRKEGF